ncbi:uncharacterized protein CBL_14039 [Carabus blaptoides fortunei]
MLKDDYDDDPQVIIQDDAELPSLSDGNASSMIHGRSMDSIQSTFTNGSSSPQHMSLGPHSLENDANIDEQEEKARLISQVLELQNTLDDLSQRVDSVKEENLKLRSENQVLGQYIENLMSASSVFQSTSPKTKKNLVRNLEKNLNYCYVLSRRLNSRSQYKKKIQQRGTHMAFACVCGQKMASMEEDNKRQSDLSITFQGGKNLLSVYKTLEDILKDKSISFERKVPTLITFWLRLLEHIRNPQAVSLEKFLETAQRHTLNLVLHGDWASQSEALKNRLFTIVEDVDGALSTCEQPTSSNCKKLIEVVKDPWGNTTLCKILNDPDKCTKEEELKYFSSEHGYLVGMRLKKLCDSHCEDLALRLANACLRCLRLPESQHFLAVTTEDQKRYILDIYIALLHRYKRTHDIINELKRLTLEEGLQLVHRFTIKRVELSRVWKHCSRIAELAAQFFMTAAMTKPVNEIGSVLTELLSAWVVLNDKLEGLEAIPTIIRRIIQTADSAAHIYLCCEVLNKKFGEKIKSFTIELYIRALTTDMNEMEKQKSQSEEDKVQETSKRLSAGFLSLADLLQDHLGVSRECVLTSFSLNPTRACMERIETLAIACGKVSSSNKSKLSSSSADSGNVAVDTSNSNNSMLDSGILLLDTGQNSDVTVSECSTETEEEETKYRERTLDALILIKGDAVTGSKNYDVLSTPNQVLDAEALGLSDQLCDDLAVVLSSPRYQFLSWVLDWTELKSTCDKYLMNVEGTRNHVKELKYLNIDYNQFKNWPNDDARKQYGGIEKGYEQWAEPDADEENSNMGSVSDYNMMYAQSNDSDCSTAMLRGRRRRKTARRIYSSESEYESMDFKVDSHGSDMDTASQDADSLGSDGLQHASSNKKSKRSGNLSHFAMIMNAHNQSSAVSNYSDDMLSIFARLEEPEKQLTVSKPSYANPSLQPFLLPEKRSSDPQVLRSLRMYRAKKKDKDDMRTDKSDKNDDDMSPCENKYSKLVNLPHMNPRVLLDRQELNNMINKVKQEPSIKQNLESVENNKPVKFNMNKLNMYPCVLLDRYEDIQNLYKKNKHSLKKKTQISDSFKDRKRRKLDVLADVPGLNTLEMIRPALVQPTVQVVQLSTNQIGSQQMRTVKPQASNTNATSAINNSITSTPVTAHIQRIGQPRPQDNKVTRTDDTENENSTVAVPLQGSTTTTSNSSSNVSAMITDTTTTTTTTTSSSTIIEPSKTSSQPPSQATPTLVNILSQQIIRPAQANSATNRSPTLINILSQQIIRPPLSQSVVCVSTSGLQSSVIPNSTSVTTTVTQAQNNLKLVTTSSSQHQILQQLFNSQGKNNNQVLKNVNLVTGITNTQSSVDTSRLVQFLCKTDGKMIQLTPYSANSNIKVQSIDSSKLVKSVNSTIPTKQVTTQSISPSPVSPPISVRSGYEENYAKFIQTSGKTLPTKSIIKETTSTSNECTAEQANSLPKFQQAFGKTVYQSSSTNLVESTAATVTAVAINNATTNVNIHGTLGTSTQTTGVTSTATKLVTANPHLQLANTTLVTKNSVAATAATTATATTVNAIPVVGTASTNKSVVPPVGVQAIQGGVIYTRQVPVSLAVTAGQTINLISNASVAQTAVGRNQVFRITSASGEQMNLVKDTVIRSKMSALLAAALQSGLPTRSAPANVVTGITTTKTTTSSSSSPNTTETVAFTPSQNETVVEAEVCDVDSSSNDSTNHHSSTQNTNTTSTLVTPMRITLPMMQRAPGPNGIQGTRIVRPVLQIPGSMIRGATAVRQQVILASTQPVPVASTSTRTPQSQSVSIGDPLMSHNNMEPLVSSTTLEQLREFDLVLEQVKERSTVQPQTSTRSQSQPVHTAAEKPAPSSIINQTSDLQEVVSGVSVSYMNQSPITQKVSPCTSVVVVTSYCNIQPAASPALSVTSQSSSSPCVTPAPSSSGSIGKTLPKTSAKSPKSKTIKATTTHVSKASPVPKPQQKPQEDEQTTQRIFDILAEYAEQLRNSPDLNNKPAPRRRSNPPTNPSQNSKRKKNSGTKKSMNSHCNSVVSDLSPGADDPRTIGSEDSSCGIVQISVQDSPSQGAPSTEDHQSTQGSSDFSSIRTAQTESSDGTTEVIENQLPTSGRQFIFTDTNTNQSRNVIIADSTVNEALGKISNTAAVIVPANYIAVVSGNSKILATVPARSGSNMLLFQSFVNQTRKPVTTQQNVKSIKYSTIQPIQGISSQTLTGQPPVVLATGTDTSTLTQTISLKNISSDNSATSESDSIHGTSDLLLNVSTTGDITPMTPQASELTLDKIAKLDESAHRSSSPVGSHLNNRENSVTQLDHTIKVLPICSESMLTEDCETKTSDNSQNSVVTQNSGFTLNFTNKSSSTVLSHTVSQSPVIEKTLNTIQDTQHKHNSAHPSLPAHGEKSQHSVSIRSVIESQTTSKSITTTNDISFPQMDCTTSVDHFAKVYTGDKKIQSNTNGPMLGQTESGVNRDVIITDSSKEIVHEKVNRDELDDTSSISTYTKQKKIQGNQRVAKELHQVQQRKQAALERELHLQKSLSEECEDLGVDEPSTSDLFPEADLLFDSNNSPSFDQLSQDADKRYNSTDFHLETSCSSNDEDYKKSLSNKCLKDDRVLNNTFLIEPHGSNSNIIKKEQTVTANTSCKIEQSPSLSQKPDSHHSSELMPKLNQSQQQVKEPTITLFSDEDNSNSTLRTDLLFGNLDYPTTEVEFDYDERPKMRQMTNCSKDGITLQSSTSNYSVSSYDEHTLLTTCASIMEVCSPIHYDIHSDSPPPIHKYKYKYCNRKKLINMQNSADAKSAEKLQNSWHDNSDVIEVLSSEDDSSGSATPERPKSPTSGSPSPTSSERKRTTIEPITCSNQHQQKSSTKIRKVVTECTLNSSMVNSAPSSPLCTSDSELGTFGIGRGTRRSTQRTKKNCPCCTSPDEPKKRSASSIKKHLAKGQFNKKR